MTSFFKKLVDGRNRSKSPQKQIPHYQTRYVYGPPPHEDHYSIAPRNNDYSSNDYSQLPPVCYLPLPPSPLAQRHNDSRLSMHHSNQSNVS
ncbi:hypothetical protein ANCCAN_04092 [Ancylostoma caninum]|uniref:Uncharacterized protein n=1 Tax=Ancylostoma caninum TaxID=29170 RepID=A0A368H3L8_ANCCA|nr:hypothetical protein ANCCAN_04092 [Ancylostoma caninum]